jgi:NAD(P)-dependent dehydrogenase (short-subunit alcohol dehydrogenase family)
MNASGEEGMRVALITGAGRGWGERLAWELAARGFHLVANDIHPAAAERTAERIRAAGGSAEPFHADVANRVAVGAMVQEILARWGRLDLIVHHAEVHPHRGLLEMGEYEWDRTVAVILKGAFNLLQAAAPAMISQRRGTFVFMIPAPILEGKIPHAAYGAGKAGLLALAHAARDALNPFGLAVHVLLTKQEDSSPEEGVAAVLDRIATLDGRSETLRLPLLQDPWHQM